MTTIIAKKIQQWLEGKTVRKVIVYSPRMKTKKLLSTDFADFKDFTFNLRKSEKSVEIKISPKQSIVLGCLANIAVS